jgi:membrane protease YdiL (CAAX protease family)
MVAVLVIVLVVAAAAVSGLVLFIVAAAMLGGRRVTIAMPSMRPAVWAGALPSARASLLEAFVLFLGLFVVASLLAEVGRLATGIDLTFVFAWLLTPIALWPLSRGLTWPGLRAAMGWTGGRGVLREMGAGVVGHLAGLPIVGLGLAVSFVIVAITGADASHPIVNDATGSPWRLAGLFLMTTVWAPLVEESMFRGALYAHLRSVPRRAADPATGAMTARGMPALASGLVTGLVFAAIHPQGFAGVPVLAALGLNFCLIREWRGSIIAPMTAHAVHNGLITAVLVVLMG